MIGSLFEDPPSNPTIPDPIEPVGDDRTDNLKVTIYLEDIKQVRQQRAILENSLHSFFTILWGQCSPGVQSKLKANTSYLVKKAESDCKWLLDEVRQLMYDFTASKYPLYSVYKAKVALIQYRQGRNQSLMIYYERFMDLVYAVEYGKGAIGTDTATLEYVSEHVPEVKNLHPGPQPVMPDPPDVSRFESKDPFSFVTTSKVKSEADGEFDAYVKAMQSHHVGYATWKRASEKYESMKIEVARNMFLGMMLVMNACKARYGTYMAKLHDDFLDGFSHYPMSPEDAFRLLSERTVASSSSPSSAGGNNQRQGHGGGGGGNGGSSKPQIKAEMSFLQTDDPVPGTDGRFHAGVPCYNCNRIGHYAKQCPDNSNVQLMQTGDEACFSDDDSAYELSFAAVQSTVPPPSFKHPVPRSWLILDSASTLNTINDSNMLSGIHKAKIGVTTLTSVEISRICLMHGLTPRALPTLFHSLTLVPSVVSYMIPPKRKSS